MQFTLNRLRVRTLIGPYDWERKNKQDVIITVKYEMDTRKAEQSDELADSLDYHPLTNEILERVEASRFNLVEKLVDYVAGIVIAYNKNIKWVEVEIEKPSALRLGDSVSLKLRKDR